MVDVYLRRERQRLALARALLADFPVLILDEPGEHLDSADRPGAHVRPLARRRGDVRCC